MLKKMLSARNGYRLLAMSLLACALPVHAQSSGPSLRCLVSEKGVGGEWVAVRVVDETTGAFTLSKDEYRWLPNKQYPLGEGMNFSWSLLSDGPKEVPGRKAVPENDVIVIVNVWGDAKQVGRPFNMPPRAALHVYRSADPEQRFSPVSASLTNQVSWDKSSNGDVGAGSLVPLETLLAFGTGMDALVWNIRSLPNELGGTDVLAKGIVPISEMRDKVSMLPKLRRLLDSKVQKFRTECNAPTRKGYF